MPAPSTPLETLETLDAQLVRMRWAAILLLPVCTAVAVLAWLKIHVLGMAYAEGLLLLVNLGTIAHARRRLGSDVPAAVRAIRLEIQVRIQLAADAAALAMVFHYAGGIENMVPMLGAAPVALVARTWGAREARIVIAQVFTASAVVVMLEAGRAVHHWHLMNDWRWGVHKEPRYIAIWLLTLLAVLVTTAWAAGSPAARPRPSGSR